MQTRSIETKARILKAAQELFSRSGYESASVAQICEKAGISKGAFYHHFSSKQSVFLYLLGEWLKGIDQGLEHLRRNQPDTAKSLIKMMEIVPVILKAAEGRLPIFLEFWAHSARDENLWKEAISPFKKYQEYFTKLIAAGDPSDSFSGKDPSTTAFAVLALAIGLVVQGVVDTDGRDWSQIGREGMQLLMEGMTRRSS